MSVVAKKDGRVIAGKATARERMDICRTCPFARLRPVMHCTKCGCVLSWKTKLTSGACPIGKW